MGEEEGEDAEERIQRKEERATAESQLPPPAGPPAAFGPHAAGRLLPPPSHNATGNTQRAHK